MLILISKSIEQTKNIAYEMAKCINKEDILLLNGEMGTGKTAFCKYFISYLTNKREEEIISPTFPIICSYESIYGDIFHLDLYRIKDKEELFELGLDEILYNHICLIEWAEKLISPPINDPIKIFIEQLDVNTRRFKIDITQSKMPRFEILSKIACKSP